MLWHVVEETHEEDWFQYIAYFFIAFTIYCYHLGPVLHEVFNPVQAWPIYAILVDLFEAMPV